jgi:PAS domain S-box-containing protein
MDEPVRFIRPPGGARTGLVIDEELAHQIIEDATDYAILTLDDQGRITGWSQGAERILGYAAEEAEGMDVGRLFLDADRAAGLHTAELEKALADGRAEDTRWHIRKSGKLFWANGVCMRRRNGDGLLKVMRDETPAKLAEDQRVLLLNDLTLSAAAELPILAVRGDPSVRPVQQADADLS